MFGPRAMTDQDAYKFSMGHGVNRLFPTVWARYRFIARGETTIPSIAVPSIQQGIDEMALLKLTENEATFLRETCPFLSPPYIDFLQGYRFNPEEVKVSFTPETGFDLVIEGPWYRTIYWEVMLLSLISETYYVTKYANRQQMEEDGFLSSGQRCQKNMVKAGLFRDMGVKIADFGTRRRFSFNNHSQVLQDFVNCGGDFLVGTSNVFMAMEHKLKPIGTQAHEWFMFHAARYGYRMANYMALRNWITVYKGNLGIALSDTFTSEAFFKAFDMEFAKLFDGVRHDSGKPIDFAQKVIRHYKELGIDPMSKTIVFSDGLVPDDVRFIHNFCKGKIKDSYGIGTNLTNDVNLSPLNMVIKMVAVSFDEGDTWVDVCKLSDVRGKYTGPAEEIELCKRSLGL